MFTNKLACLVKDLFFQERGSCETRKGLEKEKKCIGRGEGKNCSSFSLFCLFDFVLCCCSCCCCFCCFCCFLSGSFLSLSRARWEDGKGNGCYAGFQQSSHDISRLCITFTFFCSLIKGYLPNKLVKNSTPTM